MNPSIRHKYTNKNKNCNANNQHNKLVHKGNPLGCDGIPWLRHICCSLAHFAHDCSHQLKNLKDNPDKLNTTYVVSNVVECYVSVSYVFHAFNHMILHNGCSQNVARNIWVNNFIENLDQRM